MKAVVTGAVPLLNRVQTVTRLKYLLLGHGFLRYYRSWFRIVRGKGVGQHRKEAERRKVEAQSRTIGRKAWTRVDRKIENRGFKACRQISSIPRTQS